MRVLLFRTALECSLDTQECREIWRSIRLIQEFHLDAWVKRVITRCLLTESVNVGIVCYNLQGFQELHR